MSLFFSFENVEQKSEFDVMENSQKLHAPL